ncbi:recombinase XerD [Lactobacillus sp. UMNPBX2]|nr:recombinase XerD [Lactobacillus sp. UMNPBX2]
MTQYKNGKGHEDKQTDSGDFELVNLNSISIDGGFKHSGKFINESDDGILYKNDLVMILSDVGHGDLLGRVALIPDDNKFILNQRVALLRPNKTVNPEFLFFYINSHQKYFKSQGAGMSQLNISKKSVETFSSLVPNIDEQKKISLFLMKLDSLITLHHQVKGAILDAVDDGLIYRDPTRKAIFKGKAPREKKQKYLNQFELHNLLEDLDLGMEITWDWLILLIAKTGLRFSEALGLTPADFDFARQTISVNKTWDYKTNTGFQPTKNRSSIRKVQMDWQLGMQFQHLIKNLNEDEPIFVNGPVCNSTPNNCLARHCRKCGIPEISIHGLRHTHASLLMFAGVSIASVSRRLGHSSITTTQKVYMHIISELENQDNDLVMRYLSSLS